MELELKYYDSSKEDLRAIIELALELEKKYKDEGLCTLKLEVNLD